MREKFRAWDTVNYCWLKLYRIVLSIDGSVMAVEDLEGELYGLSQVMVMQSIRLLDKQGKEIYEGDTVKLEGINGNHWEVYWNNDRWGLRDVKSSPFEDYDNGDYYEGREINWGESEVIGNIYELSY